ncbi:MAG: 2-amino-4-hydroxy-6-hydroxymethyldihydropteridine diphosphokinase [Cardiobacteriaceae bacterium]|nr:2-amino-4-hydroxy-6-hydroxymethyldihydropteridine diphosphokinase [Cardiobacteriaceae bacterium]
MHNVWIAFGSNQEDPVAQVILARQTLADYLTESGVSYLYRTTPWGYHEQPDFINAVIRYYTRLEPLKILHLLQNIENQRGRKRTFKNAPRTLDLDILCYDNLKLSLPELTLPHPSIKERAFVLQPLADINPELSIDGEAVLTLLKKCGNGDIIRITNHGWQTA